jgi:tRNA-specific 2-thiouridylase
MRMRLRDVNWLGEGDILDGTDGKRHEVFVKVGSTRPPQRGWLAVAPDGIDVELLDGEEGVAPGQACVLYDAAAGQSRVLGGGFIKSVAPCSDMMVPRPPQRAGAGARG